MLKNSIIAVRDLAYELRPPSLGQLDIARTFGAYCEEFAEKADIKVEFFSEGMDSLKFDQDIEINLYRLLQESLHNIKKHARATGVRVKLIASFSHLLLSIEDNGQGFNVKERVVKASQEKRMGLRSMEERARLLHGKMKIVSRLNQGTKIFVAVPYMEKNNY